MYGSTSSTIAISGSTITNSSAGSVRWPLAAVCDYEMGVDASSDVLTYVWAWLQGGVGYGYTSSTIAISGSTITGSSSGQVRWPVAAVCDYVMGVDAGSDVLTCVWVWLQVGGVVFGDTSSTIAISGSSTTGSSSAQVRWACWYSCDGRECKQ